MTILTIILGLVVVGLAVALFFQLRLAKQHEADAEVLLRDYQRRIDEQQRLLDDYQTLQKNFDSVGKGYEKALLAFDKLEEEKQVLTQVKESLLKQVQNLQDVNGQLQAELQQAKAGNSVADGEITLR